MKHRYFLLCFLFLFSFQTEKTFKFNKPPKGYAFIPAGILNVNEEQQGISAFLMPQTEVTNGQYRLFLSDLKSQGKDSLYQLAYPDTSAWKIKDWQMEPMANMYFWHPAYANYPVVNVSTRGAELYCNWLENRLKASYGDQIQLVRLPNIKEWIYAAQAGNEDAIYPWGGAYLVNEKGSYLANFKVIGDQNIRQTENGLQVAQDSTFHPDISIVDHYFLTAPATSYQPNEFNLYNMSGNVAELTNEGVAMGGHWNATGYDIRITSNITFDKANPFVGFRPIICLK
jgi:formylglycine-generating enzyme required for sulfatase activity